MRKFSAVLLALPLGELAKPQALTERAHGDSRDGKGALFQKATNQPKLTAICFKKRHIAAKELNKF